MKDETSLMYLSRQGVGRGDVVKDEIVLSLRGVGRGTSPRGESLTLHGGDLEYCDLFLRLDFTKLCRAKCARKLALFNRV